MTNSGSQRFDISSSSANQGARPIFHRPKMAREIGNKMLGRDALSTAGQSGMFLSAPRRTGKSTFIKSDLIPYLQDEGAVTIYVDLWENKSNDPGQEIINAIQNAMREHARWKWMPPTLSRMLNALKSFRGASVNANIPGFEGELGFQIDLVGSSQEGGITISRALKRFHEVINKNTPPGKQPKQLCLLIDEAQHAMRNGTGENTLFALKAARDELNIGQAVPGLCLLATGSVRGRLSMMVAQKKEAFYGASIERLPALGEDFVAQQLQTRLADRLTPEEMPDIHQAFKAFEEVGSRPEEFIEHVLGGAMIRYTRSNGKMTFGQAMIDAAEWRTQVLRSEFLTIVQAMPPLQRALLQLLARHGVNLEPFSGDTESELNAITGGKPDANHNSISAAIMKMTTGDSPVLWKASWGSYEIDDEVFSRFMYDYDASMNGSSQNLSNNVAQSSEAELNRLNAILRTKESDFTDELATHAECDIEADANRRAIESLKSSLQECGARNSIQHDRRGA